MTIRSVSWGRRVLCESGLIHRKGSRGPLQPEFPPSPRVLYFYIVELFYHAVAGDTTNTSEATNFMSSFKVHNGYLWKILFDLQYVQINLIKSLYNRALHLACHCATTVEWRVGTHVWDHQARP